jgi:hypothetical protein
MRELFLHPVASAKGISSLYKRAFAEAVELYVLSAYLRTWDTKLEISKGCEAFSFIVGKDFGITRKKACRDVLNAGIGEPVRSPRGWRFLWVAPSSQLR